jgi:hypothetical protein
MLKITYYGPRPNLCVSRNTEELSALRWPDAVTHREVLEADDEC